MIEFYGRYLPWYMAAGPNVPKFSGRDSNIRLDCIPEHMEAEKTLRFYPYVFSATPQRSCHDEPSDCQGLGTLSVPSREPNAP